MEYIKKIEINSNVERHSIEGFAINKQNQDSSIYHAIHSAIQAQTHSKKKTFHAKKSGESLLSRLTNRIINPFGYDITIE